MELSNKFRTVFGDFDWLGRWCTVFRCTNVALAGNSALFADRARSLTGNW